MSKSRGGVRHIKDDVWEYSYYPFPKAKRKWGRVRASTKKGAILKRVIAIGNPQIENGAEGSFSFAEVRVRLETKIMSDNLSEKSRTNYLSKWDNLVKFLSEKYPDIQSINGLNRFIVENYKTRVVVEQGRETGWRDELTKLRTITRKLIDIGLCEKRIYDVLLEFKKPKAKKKLYKELTLKQLKDLLGYVAEDRPDYYGITLIIMQYGIRRGQAISIKRTNVKTGALGRPLEFRWEPDDTKTDIPHILPITDPKLANVIKRYMQDGRKTIWLFPNRDNKEHHKNHYTTYISKTSEKILGVHFSPHDLRHSYITNRRREGHLDEDIIQITGHKDVRSLDIYTHHTSEGTKRVLEASKLLD